MFTLIQIEGRLFCIVRKDALWEEDGSFKQLPFMVYGFLKVEGRDFINSTAFDRNISDEITPEELSGLKELAKLMFFNLDCHYMPR